MLGYPSFFFAARVDIVLIWTIFKRHILHNMQITFYRFLEFGCARIVDINWSFGSSSQHALSKFCSIYLANICDVCLSLVSLLLVTFSYFRQPWVIAKMSQALIEVKNYFYFRILELLETFLIWMNIFE